MTEKANENEFPKAFSSAGRRRNTWLFR